MKAVIETIDKNVTSHWNENLMSLLGNMQKLFYEMDGGLYEHKMNGLEEDRKREKTWKGQLLERVPIEPGNGCN